jgi:hypothetical protein
MAAWSLTVGMLREATKKLPILRYAWGLVGLSAVAALATRLNGDGKAAVAAGSIALIGFVLILLVSAAARGAVSIAMPARILTWSIVIFFILFLLFTVTAYAASWPCNWVRWLNIESPACIDPVPKPDPILTPKRGSVILFDGFTNYDRSGFVFRSGEIVSWGAGVADIGALREQNGQVMNFFLPYEGEIYKHPTLDRGATGGIVEVNAKSLDDHVDCPSSGYKYHWFVPAKGHFYCVRTRSGQEFAVIRVEAMDVDRIGVEFVFHPK